jgi:hypothetical protein
VSKVSRRRANDGESRRRASRTLLQGRHRNRENKPDKDLLAPQVTAGERIARWAIWASIIGLAVLALTAWPYLRSTWE